MEKINQIFSVWLFALEAQLQSVKTNLKQSFRRLALLSFSTLFSACIFVTTCVFATTMTLTDSEISQQLHHTFSQNKSLAALKITPIVIQGTAHLKGRVSSIYQAIELVDLATKNNGVKDVNTSELILKTTNKPILVTDDLYIETVLKDLYEKNQVFGPQKLDALGINIDSQNGLVILKGEINERRSHLSPQEYRERVSKAIKLGKGLKGVNGMDVSKLVLVVEYSE